MTTTSATATPAEIDTALAKINGRMSAPQANLDNTLTRLNRTGRLAPNERQAEALTAEVGRLVAVLAALDDEAAPFHAEYTARGGWTRAFLCLATGGHVHTSRACTTTFRTTQFGWLPQVSGHAEAEIVTAAGAGACTVCYPTAPVATLSQPRTLLHESEVEAAGRRAALAARKAEIAAKKAANAFGPMRGPHGKIETITAAKGFLTDAAAWGTDHPYFTAEIVAPIAAAYAARMGTTVAAEMAAAAKRAAKRN